jgi:hypothetical protein
MSNFLSRLAVKLGVISTFILTNSLNCIADQKLFWTDTSTPAIRCIDSSGKPCIVNADPTDTTLLPLTSAVDSPGGIVVDDKAQKVIFVNSLNPGKIETCDFNGSGRTTIASISDTPLYLAIDPVHDMLYWTSNGGIYKSKTDGSGAGLVTEITGNSFGGIAVDVSKNKLIWSEGLSAKFFYESDLTTIAPMSFHSLSASEIMNSMVVDEATSNIYYLRIAGNQGHLSYYPGYLSGSSPQNLISPLSSINYYGYGALALDYPAANVYYANKSDVRIYKTSLTASSPTETAVVTTSSDITSIALSCGEYAPDSDLDGTADCRDICPSDPSPPVDLDKDGIIDCNGDTCDDSVDTDGDGISNCIDTCDDSVDTDGDGISDCIDTCDDNIDTDDDGAPDCQESCDDNVLRTVPDEKCGCYEYQDINSAGDIVCVPKRQLAPNTIIENPPVVQVDGDDATFILEKFTNPTLTLKKKKKKKNSSQGIEYYDYSVEIKSSGLKVKYEVQIKGQQAKNLTSKRNELTAKNLPSGNYNVKYRAVITQNGEAVAKTKFSPSASFAIH